MLTTCPSHALPSVASSHEPGEPPHMHVDYGSASAKIWLHDAA
ncbi:DUF4160 domain-containing protein, partial [Halomonas sp. Mc5H-6]